MNSTPKYTKAVRSLFDEIQSPEELLEADPQTVAKHLQSAGVNVADLDQRITKFIKSLPGRIALAKASDTKRDSANIAPLTKNLSNYTDAQLLGRLVDIYGDVNKIPIAARTKGKMTRKELESLFLDATDNL